MSFTAPQMAAAVLADAFGEGSLSLTVIAPPREREAEVEAIFDTEPDAATLNMRVAITAALGGLSPMPKTVAAKRAHTASSGHNRAAPRTPEESPCAALAILARHTSAKTWGAVASGNRS